LSGRFNENSTKTPVFPVKGVAKRKNIPVDKS